MEVYQGVPAFWLMAMSYLVLPALTCTSHGYKAFAWEFTAILVMFQGAALLQVNACHPAKIERSL